MDWLRPPSLTEPDRNAGLSIADGEDDGNSRFSLTVGHSIVAFPSEPVKVKHLAVWLVIMPRALNPRTVVGYDCPEQMLRAR